ncbi:hypothetical protein FDECE_2072 [Fusarium decemcellulare]|nr:hypothetical protein FDECE_2072 [Fusarium decemcellulare]
MIIKWQQFAPVTLLVLCQASASEIKIYPRYGTQLPDNTRTARLDSLGSSRGSDTVSLKMVPLICGRGCDGVDNNGTMVSITTSNEYRNNQVAYLSCDSDRQSLSLSTENRVLYNVLEHKVKAVVLFTITGDSCLFEGSSMGYSIFTTIGSTFAFIISVAAIATIRAARHPEIYGPHPQLMPRGITTVALETFPIAKYGGRRRKAKVDADVELQVRTQTNSAVGQAVPEDANACSICTDEFAADHDVRVLPCNHEFHPRCVDPWLVAKSGTCPLCSGHTKSTFGSPPGSVVEINGRIWMMVHPGDKNDFLTKQRETTDFAQGFQVGAAKRWGCGVGQRGAHRLPNTLMPMSLYALVRGLSAIILAPTVGLYIDTGNRLQVVRISIVVQRIVVAASCAIFYVLAVNIPLNYSQRTGMLALVSVFACIEKLCSIMNLVSVVVIAEKDPEALAIINAQMRRIDLLCKLLGPLFIALIDGYSSELAIIVNFAMIATSVVVEYFAIAKVYRDTPKLQEPKHHPQAESVETVTRNDTPRLMSRAWKRVLALLQKSAQDFSFYFHHRAFLPSIAGAMLYLTVLSFAGQMVTYLLSVGYNSVQIGIARTLSVVLEVLATWVAPWLMRRINPLRAGLWLSSWQVVMLTGGIAVFWIWEENPLISASGLVGGTILSRVGLRGFDLCVQLIVQEDVEAESRGAFSSVEAAWQNAFELLSFASTIVFYHPDQFKWPSLISVLAVMTASISYTVIVYLRRGHLLHIDGLMRLLGARGAEQQQRDRAIDRINSTTDI